MNPKTRLLDTIQITDQEIKYAAINDRNFAYSQDSVDKIFFESKHLPSDNSFADLEKGETFGWISGSLVTVSKSKISSATGSIDHVFELVVSSSIEKIVSWRNIGISNRDFEIDETDIGFSVSNSVPFFRPENSVTDVSDILPDFLNPKFSQSERYNFLPPVNIDGSPVGSFRDMRERKIEKWEDIESHLGKSAFKKSDRVPHGYRRDIYQNVDVLNVRNSSIETPAIKQWKKIKISGEPENVIITKVYEIDRERSEIDDLYILRGGKWENREVFYAGKIYDESFVCLFTLVFED